MDELKAAARKCVTGTKDDDLEHEIKSITIPQSVSPKEIWEEIDTEKTPDVRFICEILLVLKAVLQAKPKGSADELWKSDYGKSILIWVASAILPAEDSSGAWEIAQLGENGAKEEIGLELTRHRLSRLRSTLGASVLGQLTSMIPIPSLELSQAEQVVTSLASLTCVNDIWTTACAHDTAISVLDSFVWSVRKEDDRSVNLPSFFGDLLAHAVKPMFAKTAVPAVTPSGRRNLHPLPLPRFDPGLFDPMTKPWKHRGIYAVTVLMWVVSSYSTTDRSALESHFALLIPPILSLIDDDGLAFKAKGCAILRSMLKPLEQSNSDILRRTNLDSVFEEALHPCLLFLPTITPENESIHLLSHAYPALLSVLRTRYNPRITRPKQTPSKTQTDGSSDRRKEIKSLKHLLRDVLIHSYHHISNTTTSSGDGANGATSTIFSPLYPHPRLSSFLLSQMPPILAALGLDASAFLSLLINPVLAPALTDPFAFTYAPCTSGFTSGLPAIATAAITALDALIRTAWPRVPRWRADILAALTTAWLLVSDELQENKREHETGKDSGSEARAEGGRKALMEVRRSLARVVAVLRGVMIAVCGIEGGGKIDEVQVDIDGEFKELVREDGRLHELLVSNEYFVG